MLQYVSKVKPDYLGIIEQSPKFQDPQEFILAVSIIISLNIETEKLGTRRFCQ